MIEKIDNHADLAVARLPSFQRTSETMVAVTAALGGRVQEVEDAIFDTLATVVIDKSTGAALDNIGRIVGQDRNGLDDPTYRLWLKARRLANRSSGTIPDLIAIIRAVSPGAVRVQIVPSYPGALTISVFGVAVTEATALAALLTTAKVGGVRVVFESSPSDSFATFTLDVGPGLDVGHLASALTP